MKVTGLVDVLGILVDGLADTTGTLVDGLVDTTGTLVDGVVLTDGDIGVSDIGTLDFVTLVLCNGVLDTVT